jgi:phage FluMu gp28-like protein
MDREIVEKFANEQGFDPDKVEKRWKNSPAQIAEDIFRIEDTDTGELRDLKLFRPIQTKVVNAYFYSDCGTINLYKGRRIGYSFIVVICFLLEALMIPNSIYPVVSTKQDQANNRISDIQDLIDNAKIDIPTEKENQDEIHLWNGSKFKAYSGSPDSSRGDDSARGVLLDEMAFLEDQEEVSRAFGAFLALGKNRKMFEVSTPKVSSDLFMRNHKEGSETGYVKKDKVEEGEYIIEDVPPDHPEAESATTLSIKQPSFHNADEIDINIPLTEQEVRPVRPDMNIDKIEDERRKDPKGFGQEYLCRPVDDSYAFFDEDSIENAMERDLPEQRASNMVTMGVDIGISKDDTVASVVEHRSDWKAMHEIEIVNDTNLKNFADNYRKQKDVGPRHVAHQISQNPDRSNPSHVAFRLVELAKEYDVDYIIMDRTGPGEGFRSKLEAEFGRGLIGFNFSDKDEVESMMGDMNNALRNDQVILPKNNRLNDELTAIQKEQREDWIKPKFTGKEFSESGKDDMAMASVLASFPPKLRKKPSTELETKKFEGYREQESNDNETKTISKKQDIEETFQSNPNTGKFNSVKTKRNRSRQKYQSRYSR